MPTTHIFAGNPLNRGEKERRDEAWIRSKALDSGSKFLPLWDSRVLISDTPQLELGWLDLSALVEAGFDWEPLFLGLQGETAHFAVDLYQKAEVGEELKENGK